MKAFTYEKYGPPESLKLQEVEKPEPKKGELLIKVKATAINDWDWGMVRGQPYLYRMIFGLTGPKRPTPGVEFSGIVEKVGEKAATKFVPGDRVYGDISGYGWGTFAEYITIKDDAARAMPENMSFEHAAALPHAALLAYQGMVDYGEIKRGERVLINGAGGGVGTLGFQIAKHYYEAHVTGVDSGPKLEMMQELGFDEVLDYKQTDFTKTGKKYDLVLDAKSTRNPGDYKRALKTGGRYVTVGGTNGKLFRLFLNSKLSGSGKQLKILPLKPNEGLDKISEFYAGGQLKPIIDGPYPFAEIPRLLRYFGEAHHAGKVVVTMD